MSVNGRSRTVIFDTEDHVCLYRTPSAHRASFDTMFGRVVYTCTGVNFCVSSSRVSVISSASSPSKCSLGRWKVSCIQTGTKIPTNSLSFVIQYCRACRYESARSWIVRVLDTRRIISARVSSAKSIHPVWGSVYGFAAMHNVSLIRVSIVCCRLVMCLHCSFERNPSLTPF